MSMKQGGIVRNPFQTELFERFSELSPPNENFSEGLAPKTESPILWKVCSHPAATLNK
jgi:hypothetical protein